jgi:Holliday junction DNA helicase RuvB
MGVSFIECNAPTIKNVKNLVNIFKNIKKYDIIFIDEIHRLSKACCESLYTAIQDKKLSYIDKDGNNCEVLLPDFTLIGATTHSNDLAKPFRDRFYIQIKMVDYSENELVTIIKKVFDKNIISTSDEALKCIANRSRGVPRVALGFTNRIIDKCIVNSVYQIDENFVENFFESIGVDENGLNETDRKYLEVLATNFADSSVGIDTLSSAMNEDRNIVEGVEPYLIYLGLINITKNGRSLTEKGRMYLDEKISNEEINM